MTLSDAARLEAIASNGWRLLQTEAGWLVLSVTGRPLSRGASYREAIDQAAEALAATDGKWLDREQRALVQEALAMGAGA